MLGSMVAGVLVRIKQCAHRWEDFIVRNAQSETTSH
jgi:hypothetical protein